MHIDVSFVIPAKDEEKSLWALTAGIRSGMEALSEAQGRELSFEVIFVDDGSSDGTWSEIVALRRAYPDTIRALRYERNLGKTRALSDGFWLADGDLVFTMDADLQDDPGEIPRFVEALQKSGADIVSGWKAERKDSKVKVLSSKVFNGFVSLLFGLRLHDYNCGFKLYRKEVVKSFALWGQMHRVLPALATLNGFTSTEIPVRHHARKHGESKFGKLGFRRIVPGFIDAGTVFAFRVCKKLRWLWGALAVAELSERRSSSPSMLLIVDALPREILRPWERYLLDYCLGVRR